MLPTPDTLSVTVRALGWVCLFQALGAMLFIAMFGSDLSTSVARIQRLIGASAVGGVIFITLHLLLQATRMTGDYAGFVDISMQRLASQSATGLTHLLHVIGLLIVIFGRRRFFFVATFASSVCVALGFVLVGHTHEHSQRTLLTPLLAAHVLIVAFWFGSLLSLWIILQHESIEIGREVLKRFSRVAVWVVPLIAIVGINMLLILADGLPSLTLPYGQLILMKAIGFIVLMSLAALNKWMLVPRLQSTSIDSRAQLKWSFMSEGVLIIMVLCITASLTTFYSPTSS